MVSGELPETMRKLCFSTKFPHQEIRWNYGILRSDLCIIRIHNWWLLCWCANKFLFKSASPLTQCVASSDKMTLTLIFSPIVMGKYHALTANYFEIKTFSRSIVKIIKLPSYFSMGAFFFLKVQCYFFVKRKAVSS